ncbi:MAG: helix-turn-helix domain-containing protein [Candidatus Binataceae bacterium]|nr:helix-turn-helix domain-containing protein [Candidatus Binataceae bacterium]
MSETDRNSSEATANDDSKPDAIVENGAVGASANHAAQQSLGAFLTTVREKRGVSREQVVSQTRIPGNYIAMIESDNYSAISDQLYVVPFIRRYATFLELDPEETAMRFVREVQRAESAIVKISGPVINSRRSRSKSRIGLWIFVLALFVIAILIAGLYARSRRTASKNVPTAVPTAAQAPLVTPGRETVGSPMVVAPRSEPHAAPPMVRNVPARRQPMR